MKLTPELAEKVKALYWENLEREFAGSPVFDQVVVEPFQNEAGQDTFRVTIVFDGEEGAIDGLKAINVLTAMMKPSGNWDSLPYLWSPM